MNTLAGMLRAVGYALLFIGFAGRVRR